MKNPIYDFFIGMVESVEHQKMLKDRIAVEPDEREDLMHLEHESKGQAFFFALALSVVDKPLFTLLGMLAAIYMVVDIAVIGIKSVL